MPVPLLHAEPLKKWERKSFSVVSRLTFEQAGMMPLEEVIKAVTSELSAWPLYLLLLVEGKPDEHQAAIKAQVSADPRVRFAEVNERMARVGDAQGWAVWRRE